jgi:hypothetical protein
LVTSGKGVLGGLLRKQSTEATGGGTVQLEGATPQPRKPHTCNNNKKIEPRVVVKKPNWNIVEDYSLLGYGAI